MTDLKPAIQLLRNLADAHFNVARNMEAGTYHPSSTSESTKRNDITTQNYMGNCCVVAALILENEGLRAEGDAE